MSPTALSLCLLLLPLLGAGWALWRPRHAALGSSLSLLATLAAAIALWAITSHTPSTITVQWLAVWPAAQVGFQWDFLSCSLVLCVALVAALVAIFSQYYMAGQPARYWSYLGLFASSMLGLALAPNLLQLFMCWELVGFSSFLLIGYYRTPEASRAAPLAFWTNRVGDAGLLAGVLLLAATQGSLDWAHLQPAGLAIPLLLFCGTLAKSAQFPLQVWLPAAMAGPTPASALIHAATMVAAGVFLLVRAFPLFPPIALDVVLWVGTGTALLAALAALRQTDLKRMLAFSTISQLGYMVAAVGMGAWQLAYFHLLTHALFKAALFLGAGVLIHTLAHARPNSDPQDMRQMGGLARKLPITALSMTLAAAALAGLPLTAGFLSKEAILSFGWAEAPLAASLLLLGALCTAFYAGRMLWWVFYRPTATPAPVHEHGWALRLPLLVLGAGSLWWAFGLHPFAADSAWPLRHTPITLPHEVLPLMLGLGATALGLGLAWVLRGNTNLFRWPTDTWHTATLALYTQLLAPALARLARKLAHADLHAVDGAVNAAARLMAQPHTPGQRAATDAATQPVMQLAAGFAHLEAGLAQTEQRQARGARSLAHLAARTDARVVDGAVAGIGQSLWLAGARLRGAQKGRSQWYFLLSLLLLLAILLFVLLL